ncbi:hypothetical protein BCV69DRAFT_298875 [Microstroma glucosiphilum]|uniref:Uncharacterized protein n=1 Tax=Pseudomicrostroma glucosiphilum TaxID=1684307 RepID=A0A316U9E6_9BASI|nr:hypothetical protein BCV69DRAFT_298875 [Pseudomicrostroma glucosiphilum]PWN21091.1 hypothetical protein BCV69DRAFT_298875 [Pseudomicrostroma glucosiphilum]
MSFTSEVQVYTTIQGLELHRLSTYQLHALCASPDCSWSAFSAGHHQPPPKADTQTYDLTLREHCRRWGISRSPDDLCFYHLAHGSIPKCIITCQAEWTTLWTLLSKKRLGYEADIEAHFFEIALRPVLSDVYYLDARIPRDTHTSILADLQVAHQPSHQPSHQPLIQSTAGCEDDAAIAVGQKEEEGAQRPHPNLHPVETAIVAIITRAVFSLTPTVTEALIPLFKQAAEAKTPAAPTTMNVPLTKSQPESPRDSSVTAHGGCRLERPSCETRSTAAWSVNEPSPECSDAAAPGAALASRLLAGRETDNARLGAGGTAASLVASLLDHLRSEVRLPGSFRSPYPRENETNEDAPPAESLRDTSGQLASQPTSLQEHTSDVLRTSSATTITTPFECEDGARGEQLSRSTSRTSYDGPSTCEKEGALCKCYTPETEEIATSLSPLRATPAGSEDVTSTLIEAFTEMLQKSREAGSRA